ncbi:methyl-accepting chemotaxis protein [Clostridium sp. ZS2-4]|uniref:methyl-accepting chemotaxis protein n=1 Tax=Clostridium sp. ZS2-4 TaxID=2987703 RepID=UPI00227AF821|nr:methyl-accepting chemotaxis protein [Clostridium sp. ZS2-4]MCY6354766.1 methyl-accepting chemotaxis protein [Clostridium sp. ZS2-4]
MKNSKKRVRKNSLYTRIIGLMIASILVPVILVSAISYYNLRSTAKNDFTEITGKSVEKIIEFIKNTDKVNKESVDMLSTDSNAKSIKENAACEVWLRKSFGSFTKSHKDVLNVYMGTSDKKMIIYPEQKMPDGYDPTARGWYKEAIENKGKIIRTNPYTDINNEKLYVVTFAKTVEDAAGNVIGVVGVDVTLENLSKSVEETTLGENGFSVVLDNEGTIIAHKNTEKIGASVNEDAGMKGIFDSKEEVFESNIDSVNYMVFKQKEESTGYTIAGLMSKSELTNKIVTAAKLNILVAVGTLILAIFFGNLFVKNTIITPVQKIVQVLGELTKGNFTARIKKEKGLANEIEIIIDAMNNTTDQVAEILKNILKVSDELKESSESLVSVTEESTSVGDEVARAVQQIADGAAHQSEKLNESSDIVERLGSKVDESMVNSDDMIRAAVQVEKAGEEGANLILDLTEVFKQNHAANLQVVEKVEILAEKSNEIGTITDAIKSITEQTNLLALNASIEAARAGEAGRGFSVVADEVRKLAEESANSASQIEKVIGEVKTSVNEVFEKLKLSTELNEKTGENIKITNESFTNIKDGLRILEDNIEKVSFSLIQIKDDKDLVIVNISEVSAVSQEAAATAEEVSASSEEQAAGLQEITSSSEKLNELAEGLRNVVDKFQI